MNERQTFIINRSTIAVIGEPHKIGGHGDEFSERPITFIGTKEPPADAVNISMASFDLRCEILDSYERLFPPALKNPVQVQDI